MRFIRLQIQGFKSFTTNKTFIFPNEPGLYFLTGLNEVEPDLEGNAAGKTSMWDAVTWCFYGKTPRNAKAGDIKNYYSDEKVVVSLQFEEKGFIYTLTRTWNPNSIELRQHGQDENSVGNSKYVTQEEVLGLIKLDFDHFLYSILFSQFRPQFFDLKQAEKTELFTSILNLEEWDGYSKRASQQVSHLEGIFNDLKLDVAHMKGTKEALSAIDYSDRIRKWEENRNKAITDFDFDILMDKQDLEELKKYTLSLLAEKETFTLDKTDFKDELLKHNKALQALTDDLKEVLQVEKQINEEILEIKTKLGVCNSQITKFEKLGDKCPSCLQTVDPKHVEKELKPVKKEITSLLIKDEELKVEKQEVEDLKTDLNAEKEAINKKKEKINEKLLIIQRANNKIELDLAKIDSQIKINKTEASKKMVTMNQKVLKKEQLLEEINPVLSEEQNTKASIKMLNVQIIEKSSESLDLAGTIEQTVYWVKAFKNIRLFLISEVLSQLEIETNNSLFRLGLKDWRVEFDIDKENKSGTIRKGFTILIYSPYNDEPVAWESWSGGETQRLKLAGTIGLSNLILARCGIESFVEAYDEPTQYLSAKGVDQLLETLDYRSSELEKQIWLIDHRSLEYGGFAGTYSVHKNEKGSYFVE